MCVVEGMCLSVKPSPSWENLKGGLHASNDCCRLAFFSASRITHVNHQVRLGSRYTSVRVKLHVECHCDGWSNKSHSLPNSIPSWYHFEQKTSTGPHDGKSIVRARSRYNALLFHARVACPNREPMICISSSRDGDARVDVPHSRSVSSIERDDTLIAAPSASSSPRDQRTCAPGFAHGPCRA